MVTESRLKNCTAMASQRSALGTESRQNRALGAYHDKDIMRNLVVFIQVSTEPSPIRPPGTLQKKDTTGLADVVNLKPKAETLNP